MQSKKFIKFLFNRYSLIGLFIIGYSLVLYAVFLSKYQLKPGNFISVAIFSYLFWTIIGNIIALFSRKIRLVLSIVISFFVIVLLISGYRFFEEFHHFLSSGLVDFLKNEPVYRRAYFLQIIQNKALIAGILLGAVSLGLYLYPRQEITDKKLSIKVLIVFFLIELVGLVISKHEFERRFIPLDLHTFYALTLNAPNLNHPKPLMHTLNINTKKLPVDKRPDNEKYNIVLVVFESLSRYPLPVYGYENKFMPFMKKWVESEPQQFVLMQQSMSICGATDVSMPTLYTGVGPQKPYHKLISAPFIWDYAKQNGYHTFIATSQSQEWKNLKFFIKDKYLDEYYYPEKLKLPLINDVGADDLTVLDTIKQQLLKMPVPFFFYYNHNATHGPYQNFSPKIKDFQGIKDRYGRALFITDKVVETIVDIIKQKGQMDKTIFIFTADHGDYAAKRRQRLASFFKETLDIPVIFRFPKSWIEKHPKQFAQLQKNRLIRTTNLDLAPTIFNIIFDTLPGQYQQKYFDGKSLFDTVNPDRLIYCLSTNDYRHYSSEGFALYQGNESFLFHDSEGFHYYDLSKDSLQQHDLIEQLSPKKRQYFDSIYQNNKYMKAVFERHKNDYQ